MNPPDAGQLHQDIGELKADVRSLSGQVEKLGGALEKALGDRGRIFEASRDIEGLTVELKQLRDKQATHGEKLAGINAKLLILGTAITVVAGLIGAFASKL